MKRSEEEIIEALRVDDGYEAAAPDCRQVVMARITSPRRALRPMWAFACVAALAAVAVAGVLINRSAPVELAERIVRHERVALRPDVPKQAVRTPAPAPAVAITPSVPKPSLRMVRAVQTRSWPKPASAPRPKRAPSAPSPPAGEGWGEGVASHNPQPSDLNREDRPVAAVIVSWPEPAQEADASYHYVELDASTGTVTTCSVRRTGDSVEIYMESVPGDGAESAPVKGSIENEKPNSA